MLLLQYCTSLLSHKVPRASIQHCFINMYWKLFSTLLKRVLLPWRLVPMGVCASSWVYSLSCATYCRFVKSNVPWLEFCSLLLYAVYFPFCWHKLMWLGIILEFLYSWYLSDRVIDYFFPFGISTYIEDKCEECWCLKSKNMNGFLKVFLFKLLPSEV